MYSPSKKSDYWPYVSFDRDFKPVIVFEAQETNTTQSKMKVALHSQPNDILLSFKLQLTS